MAQAVIDSLGDNIAALTGYVIQLQDANAEPPAHMAANGQQVVMVTKTLVQVAHNTAATSFKDYAFIKDEIDAEADKVAIQADELGVALNAVMTATDRVDAYGSLLNACKNIAQGTCYLLILVYGGRVKCILLKAEEVKKQIAEVRLNTGEEPSQELINEIQDLTKELATLQKFVLERAGDIVEEDDKEKLQGFGSKIQDARQGSVNSVNNWIGAPDDPEAKKLVPNQMDDVEQLVDDLIHYVDVPDNMNAMKMMEAAFKNKEGRAVMGKSAEQNKKALGGAADNLEAGAQSIPVERGLLGAAAAVARSAAQEVADVGEDPDRVEPEDSPDLTDKLRGLDAASAELIASEPNDKFKDQIANDVGRVDKAADDFDKAAIAAAADPTPEARTVVDKASEELTSALDDLLRNAKRRQDEKERAEREAAQAKLHDAADKVAAAAAAMDPDDPNRGVLEAAQQLLKDTDKTMNDIGAKNYAQLPADAKVEQDDGKAVAGAVRDLEQQLSGKVDTPVIAAVANATKEVVGAANAHAAAANGVASAPNEDARQEQSDVANAEAEHVAEAVNDLLHQLGNQKRAATAKELHDNAHVAAVMARAAEDPETQAYLANAARLGQNAADMLNAFSNDPQSIDANLGNNDDLGKALLTTGTNVANKESNPEMAKAIKENLIKASNAGSGLSDAGHRAKDDPTQEGAFNNAADDFSKALKDIVALEQQKEVADAQEALANAAKAADEAARNAVGPERTMLAGARDVADGTSALMGKSLDPEAASEVGPDSKALSKQVIDLVHATGDAGDAETNPEEKALLEATKTGMAGDAAAAIKAAKARASNPEDHDATTEMAAKSRALAEKIESLVDHADRARRARDAENALRHRDEPYGKEVGDAYDAIKRALAELHEAGDDPVKVMAATKKAIAAAHKLMDGLDALAAATADPQRKQELANARNAVGDAADGLQRAADAFVANPSDAGAKAALDAAAQGLNDATDNAMRVAGTDAAVADLQDVGRRAKKEANNSPDPIRASALDAGGDVANAAAALLADAKPHGERAAGDVAALDEAISVLEAAVGRVSDPDVASKAAADVDAVKAARNAVVAAAEALQTNPNDLAANNAAREDGMALAAAINDLVDDLTGDKAMLARLLDDAAALLRALDDLDDALARGDVAGVEAATKAAVEAARDLCQTLNDLADKEDDPTKKQQLQDAAKAINDGVEELVHDSVAWQADPTNEALKDKLAGSSQHLRDEVNKGVALAASSAARQDLEAVAAQAEAAKQANPDLPASEIAILDAIRDTAGTAAKTAGDTYDNPSAVPADAGQVAEAAAAYGAAAQGVAADNPSSAKGVLKTAENVDDASAGFGRAAEGASARTDDHEADAAAAKTLGQAATRLADTLTSALTDVPNRARTKAGADREAAQRDLAEIAHSAADLAGVDGLSPAHKSLVEAVAASAEGAADTLGRLGRGEDVEPSAGAAESAANGLGSAPAGAAVKRLVEAARGSAANPGDVGAALRTNAEAEAAVSGLNDVLGDVNNQLRADAIGALEAAADHARGAGMNTTGDAVTGVADMLKALGNGDVGPAASDALAAASRLAATVNAMPASDDAARAARAEQVEAVKSLVNEAVTAGKTAALDPSDVAAAAAANVAAKQLADAATALVDSVVADVAAVNQARRGDIKGRLEAASAAAAAASTKGDDDNTQATDRALAELASKAAAMLGNSPASGSKANADAMLASLAELEQAGSALAAAEKDPSKRQGVEAAVANVVEAARSAAAAAQEAASNPAAEDAALNQAEALADAVEAVGAETRRKRHDNARAKIKAALWALGADDANIEGFGDLLGLANLLGKKMGNLVGDIDGMHEDDVRAEAAAMQEKLREFADKAQELMDGDFADDDEAKDIIARHTAEIRRLVDLGADYANAYAANPTPENDERMVDNAEALAEEIKAFADDCRAYNESHANDPVTSEAVIDKLANEVERTARKYDNDWGDEQIVLFGHTLAELMARLAAAAREGNRPEIIAVVKEIHKIAKQASKEAKGEVANLDDDRLKENVDLAATGMTSFATQLKILGSVKAASLGGPGRDDAAENQLITCCSGVVAAMQNSINGVIAAKVYKRNH